MLKLVFFVPESHLESVKQAVFEAGAGQQGDYSNCAFQIKGVGQFFPMSGANPTLGQVNSLERVDEWRVEMLVSETVAREAKKALIAAHPYEEPAFEFHSLIEI